MKYNYQKIGDRIRKNRDKLNYNQYEFIDILDTKYGIKIGRNTLSKIENGDMPPQKITMALFIAMCDIFNCDIGYLLGEYDENTRNEKIIQEEMHLSNMAIQSIKENMYVNIKAEPVYDVYNPFPPAPINKILNDKTNTLTINPTETYINSLNLILEEYPELIGYIGRILLHKELGIYTDFVKRDYFTTTKSYDIDKPLLDLIIQIKTYVEKQKKLPPNHIKNKARYEYAIQFITKHMNALEKENKSLHNEIDELSRNTDDDDGFYE